MRRKYLARQTDWISETISRLLLVFVIGGAHLAAPAQGLPADASFAMLSSAQSDASIGTVCSSGEQT